MLRTSLLTCALALAVPALSAAERLPVPTLATAPLPANFDAVVEPSRDARANPLQAAIDAAPDHATKPYVIYVKPGRYRWQPTLIPATKRFIHLVGEDSATTTISYHLNVYESLKSRGPHPFDGITLTVLADDFSATNLTFENSSGEHGQALALRLDGDRATLTHCRLLGWQDTLRSERGRHYFRDCYIEGRVDFIYGGGTAVFERCEIRSKAGGYVTAASTPADQPFGYVFLRCRLTYDPQPWEPGLPVRPAYLGRPWRPHAAVAFIDCELGDHIEPAGWHNWSKPDSEKTARYSEYNSTGPGARPADRVAWSRQLTAAEAANYTAPRILAGTDNWNPTSPTTLPGK